MVALLHPCRRVMVALLHPRRRVMAESVLVAVMPALVAEVSVVAMPALVASETTQARRVPPPAAMTAASASKLCKLCSDPEHVVQVVL
jgi:hypothetical protein